MFFFFFFSSRRRHTRLTCDWSSDVCSSDLDRARFPDRNGLRAELVDAGFGPVETFRLSQRSRIDRESALHRVRGRFISPLQLLSEEEYETGLRRMEAELPEQNEYGLEWIVAVASKAPNG